MKKILFLDFDGVISTTRAYVAQEVIEDFYDRWIDPVAVKLIAKICSGNNYEIVVTSTWRKFGKETCVRALGRANIWLHDDWCTKDLWTTDSKVSRPQEIDDWLGRNECDSFLVIDDDSFDWTDEQRKCWIKTDQLNGISTENYEDIMNRNNRI